MAGDSLGVDSRRQEVWVHNSGGGPRVRAPTEQVARRCGHMCPLPSPSTERGAPEPLPQARLPAWCSRLCFYVFGPRCRGHVRHCRLRKDLISNRPESSPGASSNLTQTRQSFLREGWGRTWLQSPSPQWDHPGEAARGCTWMEPPGSPGHMYPNYGPEGNTTRFFPGGPELGCA